MSNEKIRHTPGPWCIEGTAGNSVYIHQDYHHEGQLVASTASMGSPLPLPVDRENARLLALAPTAPHSCDVPGCPGAENKRRLEALEGFAAIDRPEIARRLEAYPALVKALERIDSDSYGFAQEVAREALSKIENK